MSETPLVAEGTNGSVLTRSGYDRLKAELEHLTTVKRPEIAERIRDSQQHGEFSEDNSELGEVKFEQGIIEQRIGELKSLFSNATILDPNDISTDRVGLGSLVTVSDADFGDEFQVRLVVGFEANPEEDLISVESPMGSALFSSKAGELIRFDTPDGHKKYKVLKIEK